MNIERNQLFIIKIIFYNHIIIIFYRQSFENQIFWNKIITKHTKLIFEISINIVLKVLYYFQN